MYAAAGGASLASRQARQRQRQNKKQTKGTRATTSLPPKLAGQFPNYTDQAYIPKLSRVERNTLRPPAPSTHVPGPGCHDRRHSTSNYQLKEPHPRARLKESPSICIPVQQGHRPSSPYHAHAHHYPHYPAMAMAMHGGHLASGHPHDAFPLPGAGEASLLLPQVSIPDSGDKTLERRCSFVRQVEELEKGVGADEAGELTAAATGAGGVVVGGAGILDRCQHLCNFEIRAGVGEKEREALFYGGECEHSVFGSLDYPFSEVASSAEEL